MAEITLLKSKGVITITLPETKKGEYTFIASEDADVRLNGKDISMKKQDTIFNCGCHLRQGELLNKSKDCKLTKEQNKF